MLTSSPRRERGRGDALRDDAAGETEADQERVHRHAGAPEGLDGKLAQERVADRKADQDCGRELTREAQRLGGEQAQGEIGHRRATRFGDAEEAQGGAELVARQALVVEEQGERRPGDGGRAVE
jgi:hypothetical protein